MTTTEPQIPGGSEVFRRMLKETTDPDLREVNLKTWSPTPWMADVLMTDAENEDRRDALRAWCYAHFGAEATHNFDDPACWRQSCVTMRGYSWFGFAKEEQMNRFLQQFPSPARIPGPACAPRARSKFHQYVRTNKSFEEVFGGCYECDLIQPPKTVLDIGANEGAFTAWALEKWPECQVTAFEPVPENAEIFVLNHMGMDNKRVKFGQLAVSCAESLKIHLGDNNSGDCSAYDIGNQLAETVTVGCYDPIRIQSAEFVKVDTEGCEVEIISGLDLSQTVALVCEYHRNEDCRKIIEVVEKAGLKLFHQGSWFPNRGDLRFCRPGARHEVAHKTQRPPAINAVAGQCPSGGTETNVEQFNRISDDTRLSGNTPDGKLISLTAGNLRNEHFDPRLKGVRLFIGLPIYGQPTMAFVRCLMALQARKPCPIQVEVGQGDGVGRTRNALTAMFLRSDCTHLLFMDSDLIGDFTDFVTKLLLAKVPVVGGFYPKKQQGKLEWVVNTLPGNPPMRPDNLQPVKYMGTGFLCIAREVFEQMAAAYPELAFREDYGSRGLAHDFWSMGARRDGQGEAKMEAAKLLRYLAGVPVKDDTEKLFRFQLKALMDQLTPDEGRYLSEDWYFCQRWLDLGGEIFGHTLVALRHLGPVIFPLETQLPEVGKPV